MSFPENIGFDLPENWEDISNENPNGPITIIRTNSENSGALQISFAAYKNGQKPNPTEQMLMELSRNIGIKNDQGEILKEESGECRFGIYGSAEFSSKEYPVFKVWHLSDGMNFILVTYVSCAERNEIEIEEANMIIYKIFPK